MKRERIESISLVGICQKFGSDAAVFDDLNFSPQRGEISILEGSPGSGKSFLLHILAGLISPSGGKVLFNNKDVGQMSFEEFVPLRLSTSICFENGGLLMNKTLLENLKLPLVYHRGWREERSERALYEYLELFPIKKFLHHRPASVSAGVRKIAGLLRAMISNPQVIFLDEPSLGIGDEATISLKFCLEKYRREGKGDEIIVIASSDKKFVSEINCSRFQLENGKITAYAKSEKKAA